MSAKETETRLSGYHYGIAGAASGTLTRFLVQPLDVLKITFQLQITPVKLMTKAKYTSVFQAVRTIVKEEGAFALWKGHIPAQLLSVIFGAVQFSSYELLTKYFHDNPPANYSAYEHLINVATGSAAGLAATVLSFPFDVIKTHLVFQTEPKVYKGMFDAINKIYKREGLLGFSKGMTAACLQTAPMSGLVFCFHGMFTQLWFFVFEDFHADTTLNISTTKSMATGLCAGLCSKTIVYPFDLMKKRLQIQGFKGSSIQDKQMMVCKKISECFILTVKTEGFLGLFKGFVPTLIKSGATTSLYFTFYEKACQLLLYIKANSK